MMHSSASEKNIRLSIVDGLFYPRFQSELRQEIDTLLEKIPIDATDASAIITPHAAFQYVGEMLAQAFKASSGREINNVIILAPLHRDASRDLYLPEARGFATPLGTVRVNQKVCQQLLTGNAGFVQSDVPFEEEHSLEVQLPFIQRLFPKSEILPILTGTIPPRDIERLGDSLKTAFEREWENVLTVATTNMGSYRDGQSIDTHDAGLQSILNLIQEGNVRGIIEAKRKRETGACGAYCIAILLSLVGKDCRVDVLKSSSSKSAGSSRNEVVRYAALSFHEKITS
jgi:AmmeMemoRadiSam system protein B